MGARRITPQVALAEGVRWRATHNSCFARQREYNRSMSEELPAPFRALEKMSDAELLHLRAEAAIKKAPDYREIHDAELLRRQMQRQTRATRFAATAAVAAAISALANLALMVARLLGWIN